MAIAAISIAELRVGVAFAKGQRRALRQDFVEDILTVIPVLDCSEDHYATGPAVDDPAAEVHRVLGQRTPT